MANDHVTTFLDLLTQLLDPANFFKEFLISFGPLEVLGQLILVGKVLELLLHTGAEALDGHFGIFFEQFVSGLFTLLMLLLRGLGV